MLVVCALDLRFSRWAFVYFIIIGLSSGLSFWHRSRMRDSKHTMVDKVCRGEIAFPPP